MKKLILVFVVWLGVLLAVGHFSAPLSTYPGFAHCPGTAFPSYYRWDSGWYATIAGQGYKSFSATENSSVAFFPLYPMVLRVTHVLVQVRYSWLELYVNILCALATLLMVYRLARIDYDEWESFVVALVWLLFPASYFLLAGYPDALFALLGVLSLYFGRKREWGKAGVAAALLAITKPYGLLMLPVLMLEYLWSQGWSLKEISILFKGIRTRFPARIRKAGPPNEIMSSEQKSRGQNDREDPGISIEAHQGHAGVDSVLALKQRIRALFRIKRILEWWPILLPIISFSGFVLFNFFRFGNPFAFLITQRTWGRAFGNPFVALWTEMQDNLLTGSILSGAHAPYLTYLAGVVFFIVALRLSWGRVRSTYLFYSCMVMAVALVSGTLTSWGRYMFLSFPVIIGPALYLARRKPWLWAYLIVSSLSLLLLASFFVRCYPFE